MCVSCHGLTDSSTVCRATLACRVVLQRPVSRCDAQRPIIELSGSAAVQHGEPSVMVAKEDAAWTSSPLLAVWWQGPRGRVGGAADPPRPGLIFPLNLLCP